MKKIGLLILLTFLTGKFFSQKVEETYYYYQGEKVFLQENDDKILLKLIKKKEGTNIESILINESNYKVLNPSKVFGDYIVLEAKNSTTHDDRKQSLEQFKKYENVLSAHFMFRYKKGKMQGLTGTFIVKLKPETFVKDFEILVNENGCVILNKNKFVDNQYLVSIVENLSTNSMQLANLFYETDLFEFAEPNFYYLDMFNSNDPLYNNQWALKNTGQNGGNIGADIKIEQAWTITEGQPTIRIAVVDQGVQLNHPDLVDNLIAGFDATGNNTNGAPFNMTGNDHLVADFHGTTVAGIIAAAKDNGIGISGVAPKCQIIPINTSVNGNLTNQALADGLEWAWNPSFGSADIINNSWGEGLLQMQ